EANHGFLGTGLIEENLVPARNGPQVDTGQGVTNATPGGSPVPLQIENAVRARFGFEEPALHWSCSNHFGERLSLRADAKFLKSPARRCSRTGTLSNGAKK